VVSENDGDGFEGSEEVIALSLAASLEFACLIEVQNEMLDRIFGKISWQIGEEIIWLPIVHGDPIDIEAVENE
jgi:hypothetical protein